MHQHLVDAHCHLANLAAAYPALEYVSQARLHGITNFVSNALTRDEAQWHLRHPHPDVLWHAGIHPSFDACDLSLADLDNFASHRQIVAIGEIGLDRSNPDLAWQIKTFISQLELADTYNLPVVLHLVGHTSEAVRILKRHHQRYLVHGYAGSLEGFRSLASLGACFTVSGRICKPDKLSLLKEMIHLCDYLFETDITRYYMMQELSNPFLKQPELVNDVVQLTGADSNELCRIQAQNFQRLFGADDGSV